MKFAPCPKAFAVIFISALLAAGCASHPSQEAAGKPFAAGAPPSPTVPPSEIILPSSPPDAVVELPTKSPSPGLLWVPGHWLWQEERWVWFPGQWTKPPRPGAVWEPGYLEVRDGQTHFKPGYWRW